MVMQLKIIVEKHSDGYVAYPLGLKGVVIGARAWHANGDEVVEGDEAGPHIPVQG